MPYCSYCGNEMNATDRFCDQCGRKNEAILVLPQKQKSQRKRRWITIAAIAAGLTAAIVILVVVLTSNRLKLPYAWGTSIDVIRAREEVVYSPYPNWLRCRAKGTELQNIAEFPHSTLEYRFDDNGKLYGIWYQLGDGYRAEARIEILKQYFGDNYYQHGGTWDRVYWRVGNTMIIVAYRGLVYEDLNYFINHHDANWSDKERDAVIAYFHLR